MTHPFSDIPELVNLDAGRGLVRIPMEQDVPFTPRVRAIVDTPEFQRLAKISQLGLTSLVYPGATHSRFEHALGVFNNALSYLWQLAKDQRFRETVDRHTAETLMATALLHDLGHWPFCHPIEDMSLAGVPTHEQFAEHYLRDDGELATVLRDEWGVRPEEVREILVGTPESRRLKLMQSVLSGPIDIDKMDYLDRDSLHAGVPYGRNFDKSRLVQSLLVNEAGDGLAISAKGKTAAELMVFARYVMFSEVYWHHAVRSATCMFMRAFFELHDGLDLDQLFRQSDSTVVAALIDKASETDSQSLLDGLFGTRRRLHKRVVELSHYQQTEIYEQLRGRPYSFLVECARNLTRRLATELKIQPGPTDVLIDAPPVDREVEFRVQIYFPKERVYRPLAEVSPVVEALAKRQFDDYVKRVRVFASVEVAEQLRTFSGLSECLTAAIADTE